MSLSWRKLGDVNSSPESPISESPEIMKVDSDFVVILAALVCALICVLGLVVVSRCSWIRRIIGRVTSRSDPPALSPPPPPNRGLKKKILKSLPKLTYTAEDVAKMSECAICLTEFVAGDEVRVLPQCGHGYHVSCIDKWLGTRSSCPSCRKILVVGRCEKCGGLPETEAKLNQTAEPAAGDINRFLP